MLLIYHFDCTWGFTVMQRMLADSLSWICNEPSLNNYDKNKNSVIQSASGLQVFHTGLELF